MTRRKPDTMFGGNPFTDAASATPEAKALYAVIVVFVILGMIYLYRLFWTKTCPMPQISMPWSSKEKEGLLGADPSTYTPHAANPRVPGVEQSNMRWGY